ncbi:MAG: hypothetical protein Q9160_001688 [Pyrenula sp. 1 TL-2023]
MQKRLEELEDAPKIVQERQDDLNSLASIVKAIEQNPQLQEPCLEIHLTRVKNLIEELNRLLAEKLRKSANRSIQKFCRALIAPKADEKIHSAFLALEGAKSNLHLYISNSFGENTHRLLENFSDKKMSTRDKSARRNNEKRPNGKKTNTPPHHEDRHELGEADGRAHSDKELIPHRNDRSVSGNDRPMDERVRPECSENGKKRYEPESDYKLAYRGNVADGKVVKVNSGPHIVNPPDGFEIPKLKYTTTYEENRTHGESNDTTWGLKMEWSKDESKK